MVESRLAVPDDAAGPLSLRHRLDAPVLVHAARPADAVPTAGETSACSTSVSRTPDPHAIESQSVRLSANGVIHPAPLPGNRLKALLPDHSLRAAGF